MAYFDETGDDGANNKASFQFVIISAYRDANSWWDNYDRVSNNLDFGFVICPR